VVSSCVVELMTIKVMPGLDGSGPWVMFEGAGMMAILNRARKVLLLWAQVHPVMWRVSLKALAGMVKLTPALSAVVLNAYSAYSNLFRVDEGGQRSSISKWRGGDDLKYRCGS